MRNERKSGELWVFGYGSLMWRPDFDFIEQAHAALIGAHRSLCIYSVHHRGTQAHPGLVLGLDEGGACRGIAFRVAPELSDATLTYLREREQVTDVYVETTRPVSLLDGTGRELEAVCYIVDRGHPQYAGSLSLDRQAELVGSAVGNSGANIDYVLNTVRHLEEAGIHDVELAALAQRLAGSRTS
jgi:glutathione-specific gamma-glutamylcyclotransferase